MIGYRDPLWFENSTKEVIRGTRQGNTPVTEGLTDKVIIRGQFARLTIDKVSFLSYHFKYIHIYVQGVH